MTIDHSASIKICDERIKLINKAIKAAEKANQAIAISIFIWSALESLKLARSEVEATKKIHQILLEEENKNAK